MAPRRRADEYRPTKRGFDEFYGTLANTPFFHPTHFVDSRVSNDVQTIEDDDFYTTDAYAERAVDWIGKQQGQAVVPVPAVQRPARAAAGAAEVPRPLPEHHRREAQDCSRR